MIYKRNPYYNQIQAKNHRQDYLHIAPVFQELIDALVDEKDVFEIGFDMGQRLVQLRNNSVDIAGGVEFEPMFGTYGNKHFGIYEGYQIVLTNIDDWFDVPHKVYFTYKFLEEFSEEDRVILIERIKELADKHNSSVYFTERFNIPGTTRVGEIQVYVNDNRVELDDRETDSETESEDNSSVS